MTDLKGSNCHLRKYLDLLVTPDRHRALTSVDMNSPAVPVQTDASEANVASSSLRETPSWQVTCHPVEVERTTSTSDPAVPPGAAMAGDDGERPVSSDDLEESEEPSIDGCRVVRVARLAVALAPELAPAEMG